MFKDYPDVLSVDQMAQALGIGRNKAYELIHNREIGFKRIGRRFLIPKISLIDYLTSARYAVGV